MVDVLDFPKLESPFIRKNGSGRYLCTPEIKDEFRWVFEEDCVAVDKLDGTNVSVLVENSQIVRIFNRTTHIPLFTKNSLRFYVGVINALNRKYFIPGLDEQKFGELIGPKIQGNPYRLSDHRWVPFSYLKKKYAFRFWGKFVKELQGKSDGEIHESVSELFKGLRSPYKGRLGFDQTEVNENVGFSGMAAEGIVFYSPDGKMAKLRRDMFDWWQHTPAGQRYIARHTRRTEK